MRNAILGFASLLIAIVLWLQVSSFNAPDREREVNTPLVIQNLPAELVAVDPPEFVRILVSGSHSEIEGLDSGVYEAYVDASRVVPGEASLPVELRGPSRPTLSAKVMRPKLDLTFARVAQVNHTVDVQETGLPPGDLIYEGAVTSPMEVTLTGPDTSLRRVATVRVVLDLTKVRPRSSFSVGVEALDSEGKPVPSVASDPSEVMVTPAVGAAPTSKRVFINPNFVGQLPLGFRLERYELRPPQADLTGSSADLGGLSVLETEPISLEGIQRTTVKEVGLIVPQGIRIKGRTQVRVTLVVTGAALEPAPTQPSGTSP